MDRRIFNRLFLFLVDNQIWVLVVLSIFIFSSVSPRFFTPFNLVNILLRVAPLALLVIGQSFTLITGNFDLSAESTMGLTAMIAGLLLTTKDSGGLGIEMNSILGIIVMVVAGALIGLINGIFITKLKMNNFIMTVAMMMILRGATYAISPGTSISLFPEAFKWLGGEALFRVPLADGKQLAIPVAMFFVILAFAMAFVVTRYTRFGRNMFAVGSSRPASEAAGIDSGKIIIAVYIIGGICAALAGLLDAGRMDSATPRTGSGLIFPVQAAAVVGGISLFGGRGSMIGAFGGLLLWGIIDTGLNIAQVSPFWIEVSRGGLLLFAIFIDTMKVKYLRRVSIRKAFATNTIGLADAAHQLD